MFCHCRYLPVVHDGHHDDGDGHHSVRPQPVQHAREASAAVGQEGLHRLHSAHPLHVQLRDAVRRVARTRSNDTWSHRHARAGRRRRRRHIRFSGGGSVGYELQGSCCWRQPRRCVKRSPTTLWFTWLVQWGQGESELFERLGAGGDGLRPVVLLGVSHLHRGYHSRPLPSAHHSSIRRNAVLGRHVFNYAKLRMRSIAVRTITDAQFCQSRTLCSDAAQSGPSRLTEDIRNPWHCSLLPPSAPKVTVGRPVDKGPQG